MQNDALEPERIEGETPRSQGARTVLIHRPPTSFPPALPEVVGKEKMEIKCRNTVSLAEATKEKGIGTLAGAWDEPLSC